MITSSLRTQPPILRVYESVCVCRYNRMGQGGWFSIYVVQCLLISPMSHLSHQQFKSFHATGLSTHGLPLASGYTQHARLHICIFMCECCTPENVLHKCMILHVRFKIFNNCASEKSRSTSLPSGEKIKDCHLQNHFAEEAIRGIN